MIAGLPWPSWLLLFLAVGTGLVIEVAFFRAHRGARRDRSGTGRGRDPPPRDERDPR